VQSDSLTFVGVVNTFASLVALEEGRCTHEQIILSGWDSAVFVGDCLDDMYAKCGSMEDAECSMRCHCGMWSLGTPYLEDLPCMGMVRKRLH
jgi:hypothetical protein